MSYNPIQYVRKNTLVFNVKDYGATGDGVANDTTAIQAAITAANAAGGGTVFFGPGTFNISTVMTLYSNITIEGSGVGITIIKQANAANITMMQNSDSVSGNTDICLRDLTVDGNKANQTSGGRGFLMVKVTRPMVINVYFHDCRNRAVDYQTCSEGLVEKCHGINCGVFQEQIFTIETDSTRCIFSDCFSSGGTDRDFIIAQSTNCEVHNCISVNAVGAALSVYSVATANDGIVVDGFMAINPAAEGIYLERVTNSQFSNIRIYNPGTEGIRAYGVVSITADNLFDNIFIYNPTNSGIVSPGIRSVLNNIKIYSAGNYGIRVSEEVKLSNCLVDGAGEDCYWIESSYPNCSLTGCSGKNGGQNGTGGHLNGVKIEATYTTITGGRFYDDQSVKTQSYGIREIAPADYNTITGVNVVGNGTAGLLIVGANTDYANNTGY